MLSTGSSVVALAKKMAKTETKTVTRTVAVPKTKLVTQRPQQPATPKGTERTEERVWIKHVLRLTLCNYWVRKLLNSNRRTSVDKTCKVVVELHTTYTLTIFIWYMIDIKQQKNHVAIEWE